ncbi:MAG: cobalamin-dependent protein [Dehalococcoidia bacterium]|nr:cobalamin-dependent protein [Dehalococcoidia bacterium]
MNHKYRTKPRAPELRKHQTALLDALIAGDETRASDLIEDSITKRWAPATIYLNLVAHAMTEIGDLWHRGDLNISTEHRATQIAFRLLARVKISYPDGNKTGLSAIVSGVSGDTHLGGALIFADLLRFDGWDVDFLGTDTPEDAILEIVKSNEPDLLCLSVTLPDQVDAAKETVRIVKSTVPSTAIIVGGGAISKNGSQNSLASADYVTSDPVTALKWTAEQFDLGISAKTIQAMLAELGGRIQHFRKEKGLSQQQLATASKLDRSYVSAVEHGKQNVSFATLKNLSDALNVNIAELIND